MVVIEVEGGFLGIETDDEVPSRGFEAPRGLYGGHWRRAINAAGTRDAWIRITGVGNDLWLQVACCFLLGMKTPQLATKTTYMRTCGVAVTTVVAPGRRNNSEFVQSFVAAR
jgi:hypothetical protein